MKKILTFLTVCTLAVLFSAICASADDPVAQMVNAGQGVTVLRAGKTLALDKDAPVFQKDVIKTGPKSKAEIKFNDGTIITMGPGSEVKASEFAMTEAKSSFAANVAKGAARVVTGNIVKRNPAGFKVNTPRSTVGIRGTTVTFFCGRGEIITIENIGPGSYLTVTDRDSADQIQTNSINELIVTPENAPTRIIPKTQDAARTLQAAFDSATVEERNKLLNNIEPSAAKPLPVQSSGAGGSRTATPNDAFVLERQQNNKTDSGSQPDKTVNTSPKVPVRCD